jgi:CBS-domain-containing membrane protein
MRLTDSRFSEHVGTYILQCGLATMTVTIVLLILDATLQTAIIASIGASVFIVFTAPNAFSAKPRALIGGYLIGSAAGISCSLLADIIGPRDSTEWNTVLIAMGAVSVGISIFIMVITDSEHPPAAGLALAFVLNTWNSKTVAVVIIAPILLSLIRYIFRKHIRDLV